MTIYSWVLFVLHHRLAKSEKINVRVHNLSQYEQACDLFLEQQTIGAKAKNDYLHYKFLFVFFRIKNN